MPKNQFRRRFQHILRARVKELLDFKIQLAEVEMAEGWHCFYAREVWLKDNLPPPLINDIGRKFALEFLLEQLSCQFDEVGDRYFSDFRRELFETKGANTSYRNYLDVGEVSFNWVLLDGEILDKTAYEVFRNSVKNFHRHPFFEIQRNAERWKLEVQEWASLTSPFMLSGNERQPLIRDESLPLLMDIEYWKRYYDDGFIVGSVLQNDRSDPIIKMMVELARDFPLSKSMCSKNRLVFSGYRTRDFTWCIVFERVGGYFLFPPTLLLVEASNEVSWSNNIIFRDVLRQHIGANLKSGRGDEIFLLYVLPRYRRLINFYQSFINDALPQTTNALEHV